MKSSMIISALLIAIIWIILTGCQQVEPQMTTGSCTLTVDVVAHYYKSNASTYMTSQEHGFDPDNHFFQMTADEPIGPVKYSLDRGVYSVSGEETEFLSVLPKNFFTQELATAVFFSYTAAAGLLDSDSMSVSGDDVKIEGQWYTPLSPAWSSLPEVTLFRSPRTNRIELVEIDDEQDGLTWLLRSYNFYHNNEFQKQFPRTIDVFNIGKGISAKELMIRFDYKNIRKVIPE